MINEFKRMKILNDLLPAVFSLQFLVTAMYWILYFINPKLVWSEELIDKGFKPFLPADICAHGLPYVILFLNSDSYLVKPRRRPRIFLLGFFVFYVALLHLIFIITGEWPYQVLEKITGFYRFLFLFGMLMIADLHYTAICMINESLRGNSLNK
ncbi:hypothetical protein DMUE_2364 [Dictyocoela muelleri]|nr:hypothetical protein DMUE_2364 [Dictyocoela muelleri]